MNHATEIDAPGCVTNRLELVRRFPVLRTHGIAVERFPRYTNTQPKLHGLDVVLFTCVLAGSGTHLMGDQSLPVGPGSVGITHYGRSHDLLTEPAGMDVVNVYLDLRNHPLPVVPPTWSRVLASILAPHPCVLHRQNRRVHLPFDQPARMTGSLTLLLREQADALPGYEVMMRQLLVPFLIECCRVADRMGWASGESAPPWVEDVQRLLDRTFDRPLGLADLTRRAKVSAEHLCRRFRQHTGLSPIAYLNNRRLQHAMWLLRTTNQSVTQVAVTSGFSELSYFNRKFKDATGITPTLFRRGHTTTETSDLT